MSGGNLLYKNLGFQEILGLPITLAPDGSQIVTPPSCNGLCLSKNSQNKAFGNYCIDEISRFLATWLWSSILCQIVKASTGKKEPKVRNWSTSVKVTALTPPEK